MLTISNTLLWIVAFGSIIYLIKIHSTTISHPKWEAYVIATPILLLTVISLIKEWSLASLCVLLFIIFIIAPGWLMLLTEKAVFAEHYRLAQALYWISLAVHPLPSLWQNRWYYSLLLNLSRGNRELAETELIHVKSDPSLHAFVKHTILLRLLGRYDELVQLWEQSTQSYETKEHPSAFFNYLYALEEMGQYDRFFVLLPKFMSSPKMLFYPTLQIAMQRLLFIYAGQPKEIERLNAEHFRTYSQTYQQYWLASALQVAGRTTEALAYLKPLSSVHCTILHQSIQDRIANPLKPLDPLLQSQAQDLIRRSQVLFEQHQGFYYGKFSKKGLYFCGALTLLLILIFTIDCATGYLYSNQSHDHYSSSEWSPYLLFQLGAYYYLSLLTGELWRLITPLFLHANLLHLGFNILALMSIGPPLVNRLGLLRFTLLYLASGLAGTLVLTFSIYNGWTSDQAMMIGASGSIMGILGGHIWISLYEMLWTSNSFARNQFIQLMFIFLVQNVFDYAHPPISMLAHITGAVSGFLLATSFYSPRRLDA